MKIITLIQARTTSTRLPGKVLFPLEGSPLLIRLVERLERSVLKGKIIVATSVSETDNAIEEVCAASGIECFRGHLTDLLDRHYKAAIHYLADAVVKIPSDCPLIDPAIVDRVIRVFISSYPSFDYVSNLHPPSYPDGNDVEIISFPTLALAWKEASREFEREHTTPYMWENPEKFAIGNVYWETGRDYSGTHRWTIDYEEDYQFIKKVYQCLFHSNAAFGLQDILQLLHDKPWIAKINRQFLGRYWYENHLDVLNHIPEYKIKLKLK